MIKVTVNNQEKQYASSMTLMDICGEFSPLYKTGIIAALKNNQLFDLSMPFQEGDYIEFIGLEHELAGKILIDSLTFLFVTACADILPRANVSFSNDTEGNILCLISVPNFPQFELSPFMVRVIHHKMVELIERDVMLSRVNLSKNEITRLFNRKNETLKFKLLNSIEEDVDIYYCDGYFDCFNGPLVPSAKYLESFQLFHSETKNTIKLALRP